VFSVIIQFAGIKRERLKMKRLCFVIFLLAACILSFSLTGCSGSSNKELEDKEWVLESFGDRDNPHLVIEGTEITITFMSDEKQVTGSAGCNGYFGEYEIKDGLTIGMIGSTEMYCQDPEGVMNQETEYLRLLGLANSYSIENGKLRLSCGEKVLVYVLNTDK
jgi:heat shock protein HslJ